MYHVHISMWFVVIRFGGGGGGGWSQINPTTFESELRTYDIPNSAIVLSNLRQDPPLDLSFWSFLTFLHHGIEDVERHLL